MTDELARAIRELRLLGYAVCIFTPEELNGAIPRKVEEELLRAGLKIIDIIREEDQETKLFKIAFCKADGSWDIYEKFYVYSESEANRYAYDYYSSHPDSDLRDCYVLDENNRNINGGE